MKATGILTFVISLLFFAGGLQAQDFDYLGDTPKEDSSYYAEWLEAKLSGDVDKVKSIELQTYLDNLQELRDGAARIMAVNNTGNYTQAVSYVNTQSTTDVYYAIKLAALNPSKSIQARSPANRVRVFTVYDGTFDPPRLLYNNARTINVQLE